jgi:hypothetical protein
MVHDRRTGAIAFIAEEYVFLFISDGRVSALGNRRAVHELRWHGDPWKPVMLAAEAAGYKPSRAVPDKYSHNRATRENPRSCMASSMS